MFKRIINYIHRQRSFRYFTKLLRKSEFDNSYLRNKLSGMIIGKDTRVDPRAYFMHGGLIEIGDNCDINAFCTFMTQNAVIKIGDNVAIAPHVSIIGDNMDHSGRGKIINSRNLPSTGVTIGDDCWIGVGAIILPDVKIGKGSVVAAGAVVTKDVKNYVIVAGNPAKQIKKREQ